MHILKYQTTGGFSIYSSSAKSPHLNSTFTLTDRGHNNSRVGTEARSVLADKATMNLDLHSCDTKYKRHLVIHEFGHALGLGHEHQRSSFWSDIRPHIDQAKMKRYFRKCMRGLSERDFNRHWEQNYAEDVCSELGQSTEYDSDSVMHYW